MAGVTFTADLAFGQASAAFAAYARTGRDGTRLLRAIGVGMVENVRTRIEAEQSPDGTPFAPLLPAYASIKKGPGILRGSSSGAAGLSGSMTFRTSADALAIGTNKIYGAIHQFGGVIRAKNPSGRLRFRLAHGMVAVAQVTIRARPYLGIGPEDEDTILDACEVFLLRGR